MRSAGILSMLAACLLGQSAAFITSPARCLTFSSAGGTKLSVATSSRVLSVGGSIATRAAAAAAQRLVMAAGTFPKEDSVARYKKCLGKKKWEEMDRPEMKASTAFDEISRIYGEENAVEMVKAVPSCLGYDPVNFKGTFDAFSENFGAEETIGMVTRNPNLLSVRPTGFGGATNAKSDTMTMSYIIAYTRPLGPFLLYGLFLVLALPFIEIATGIPRGQFISVAASKFSG